MAAVPRAPEPRKRTLTEEAIDAAIAADGGNRYRALLQKHLPLIDDAYRQDDGGPRSHLGASLIGEECPRKLWYGWRWVMQRKFQPRIIRLFNRGHREEASFLAMLEMIGVHFHQPEGGGQERISDHGGHFGSALDGVLWGVPDAPGEWVLGEFKTSGTKPFSNLVNSKGGVATAMPKHMAQMQTCMARRGIHKCLYMVVNKNDDDLYCEIVTYNPAIAASHLGRARDIIYTRTAPAKLSLDPSHFQCGFCDHVGHCQRRQQIEAENCRTCRHSVPVADGTWRCELRDIELDKGLQLVGCESHEFIPDLVVR